MWPLLLFACSTGPTASGCPPGMVLVHGDTAVGMAPSVYGIVQTRDLTVVDAPERRCPEALAAQPGALACWVQTDQTDPVVPPHSVQVAPFCIEAMPFPGDGARYTRDGMTAWDAEQLDQMLRTGHFGTRRSCTFSEFEVAVAGPRANRPFVFGAAAPGERCPDDALIGADPDCANPETGVHEYGAVMSHWVRADAALVAHGCPSPPCVASGGHLLTVGAWVVAGGTRRLQTRQAPLTPHTWHDHGEPNPQGCDDMGHDDQPVICADPDPGYDQQPLPTTLAEGERRWNRVRQVARDTGSMTKALEAGLGRTVCPAPSKRRESSKRQFRRSLSANQPFR